MAVDAAGADQGQCFSVEQASKHALDWCAKNPSWIRICDLEDSNCYYVQWGELSERQRSRWGSEYAYNEFAQKRQKVKTGFISGKGEFFSDILDVPRWHNSMMVFRVGVVSAKQILANRLMKSSFQPGTCPKTEGLKS